MMRSQLPKSLLGNLMTWSDHEEFADFKSIYLDEVLEALAAGAGSRDAQLKMPFRFRHYYMHDAAVNAASICEERTRSVLNRTF